jgi:hypothetical protein
MITVLLSISIFGLFILIKINYPEFKYNYNVWRYRTKLNKFEKILINSNYTLEQKTDIYQIFERDLLNIVKRNINFANFDSYSDTTDLLKLMDVKFKMIVDKVVGEW